MSGSGVPFTAGQLLDRTTELFGLDPGTGLQFWEGAALLAAARLPGLPTSSLAVRPWIETQGSGSYTPPLVPFPLNPTAPVIIWGSAAKGVAPEEVHTLLATRYPAETMVVLATFDQTGGLVARSSRYLADLPTSDLSTPAYWLLALGPLPISSELRSAEGLRWIMARLLGPDGCPWDVRQTHRSLRGALLEETYELFEAIAEADNEGMREELGDLLISIFAHGEMARQQGNFAIEDVFAHASAKLIRRHPHVFANLHVDGEGAVLRNWEQIKAAELAAKGRTRASLLDGVPMALPALAAAQALGKKAARAGFNWTELDQVWVKLHEELDELAAAVAAGDTTHSAEELGDLLFVVTRLADWLQIDAELALQDANAKFCRRFHAVEAAAAAQARPLSSMDLAELIALWETAKASSSR
jgi:tetrapyrrole methylase family protein/MazG family protein